MIDPPQARIRPLLFFWFYELNIERRQLILYLLSDGTKGVRVVAQYL